MKDALESMSCSENGEWCTCCVPTRKLKAPQDWVKMNAQWSKVREWWENLTIYWTTQNRKESVERILKGDILPGDLALAYVAFA